MFQLTSKECSRFKSQVVGGKSNEENWSQFATGSSRHRDPRFLPLAFTDQRAVMSANVLNSEEAIRMSVFVVRAFVQMREFFVSTSELMDQLKSLEAKLTARLDVHETAIVDILQRLMDLLNPAAESPQSDLVPREIGFHTPSDGGQTTS